MTRILKGPALAEDIERLARLAYPDAPPTIIDTLARDQFVDSIPDNDMRLRLRQERLENLQRVLELALELESFNLANREQRVRVSWETKLREDPSVRNSPWGEFSAAKKKETEGNIPTGGRETPCSCFWGAKSSYRD